MAKCKVGFKSRKGKCLNIKSKQARKFTGLEIFLTIILMITGLYYLFFPHTIHIRFSPDHVVSRMVEFIPTGFPHWVHMTFGVILIILAIFIIFRRKFR